MLSKQAHVDKLLASMTLEEKIGQMTQVDQRAVLPADVTRWCLGSILSGGGANPTPNNPQNWAAMVIGFQEAAQKTRLGIPMMYGVDAVHGHSNVVGATIFPHNIGLGATRDPDLVRRIGQATARETSATGVTWNFAPCVAVPQDIRWGRTYEGFSEDVNLVAELSAAYVSGLQGEQDLGAPGSVLACPKHFIADGGTTWGTTRAYPWVTNNEQAVNWRYKIDQGDAQMSESQLRQIHLPPYLAAIQAGARSIMVSFSSWNGAKMHAHSYLLTDVLKGELGFDGFLVSDWQAIDQLSPDYEKCVVSSINAGLDMVMVPFEYQRFINALKLAVERGEVAEARINDAVRRILAVKLALGLFERKFEDEPPLEILGCEPHRRLAREAVRKSLVVLKNDEKTLPIAKDIHQIILAGPAADDVGLQCGGWTIEWQGGQGDLTPGTSLLQAIRQTVSSETSVRFEAAGFFASEAPAEVGIVCLHEPPYAEGLGDRADLALTAADIDLIRRVRAHCLRMVVIIFSGRPLIITQQLSLADAWVAAWLPGTEGLGITDVLFGDYPPSGRLPYTWPRTGAPATENNRLGKTADLDTLFPLGYGLDFS